MHATVHHNRQTTNLKKKNTECFNPKGGESQVTHPKTGSIESPVLACRSPVQGTTWKNFNFFFLSSQCLIFVKNIFESGS